jgi:hypothetical protein
MPVTSVVPANFIIGPAFARYRAVASTGPFTEVGVTLDDAVMRIPTEWMDTSNLSGVVASVMGLDVLTSLGVEIEFTIAEVFGQKLALAIPGATYTAEVHADSVSTPFSSTTTAAIAAGASVVPVTSATNLSVGDYFRIETAANASVEYRQVVQIQSLNVTVDSPLHFAHLTGVAVAETTGDGRSMVTPPIIRRQPNSAYYEWSLIAESGLSGWTELRIPQGISQTTSAELSIADDSLQGIRVTIAGRLAPTDLTQPIFRMYAPTI